MRHRLFPNPSASTGSGSIGRILLVIFLILSLAIIPSLALALSSTPVTFGAITVPGNQTSGSSASFAHPEPTQTLIGDVEYPYIQKNLSPGIITRSYTFPFLDANVTVMANVSVAVYDGAHNGIKYAIAQPGNTVYLLAPGYFNAFVNDPRQDPFYSGILQDLRAIRSQHNLTDDEYLELMTVFVQSLPYDEKSGLLDLPPRFPVETFVDGTGNCEDKSVLLAGLLSQEGYNVTLFLFMPEHHIAVGVQNSSSSFQNTGYLYIETTNTLLVGEVPSELAIPVKYGQPGQTGTVTITNVTPLVIRVGNGTKGYTSADEVEEILVTQKTIESRIAQIQMRMGNCSFENTSCNQTLEQEYDLYAVLYNYIATHLYDRAGLYEDLHFPSGSPEGAPSSDNIAPANKTPTTKPAVSETPPFTSCRFSFMCLWQNIRHVLTSLVGWGHIYNG
ncbi:hypothetical protein [Methanoregula sp.]|uniref:hypothetical protein n=1 Tax=Methanoregula sp. TaxID=2052170 RepID=UPI003C76A2B2